MNRDLFSADLPLPERLRPANFDEMVGQKSLLNRLKATPPHSMILCGPPGCGKTTLARLIAKSANRSSYFLSAVSASIKDVRDIIDNSKKIGGGVILFLDEIHRFNKSQQDALLHAVEDGSIILIGATTENPSFEVIGPLLSRCQVYRLESLSEAELTVLAKRGFAETEKIIGKSIQCESEVIQTLVESSTGDARKLLRLIELIVSQTIHLLNQEAESNTLTINIDHLKQILSDDIRAYDKAGENHYNYISAFIKSLRGSDPDAALLYLAVMIEAGEDPLFIARRMVIFASEDIGNASPTALSLAVSCFQAIERIGMPEGRIILGQCATFLASSPKSNASYLAMNDALSFVKGKQVKVPNHLKNVVIPGEEKGRYLYPHDFPDHFVKQDYLPKDINQQFYKPGNQGQESRISERLKKLHPNRNYNK
ncbi:MAG: replication-associated recombination protein A [Leptonema sp. (in: Bacteria)]|nr:replication-associated recombination protein A [Leptonema sp. (in: bacteria)]